MYTKVNNLKYIQCEVNTFLFLYKKTHERIHYIFLFNLFILKRDNNNNLIVKTKRVEHLRIIIIIYWEKKNHKESRYKKIFYGDNEMPPKIRNLHRTKM